MVKPLGPTSSADIAELSLSELDDNYYFVTTIASYTESDSFSTNSATPSWVKIGTALIDADGINGTVTVTFRALGSNNNSSQDTYIRLYDVTNTAQLAVITIPTTDFSEKWRAASVVLPVSGLVEIEAQGAVATSATTLEVIRVQVDVKRS